MLVRVKERTLTETWHNTGNFLARNRINDEQKTKQQLLEELARERELVERERERSMALSEVSKKVAAAYETDEVLDLIVNEAARFVGAPAAFLRLLKGGVLVAGAATESAAAFLADDSIANPGHKVEQGTSAVGHEMFTKKPYTTIDATNDELLTPESRRLAEKHGFHGLALAPLVANDRSIGVLHVLDTHIRLFTEDEVSLLTAFADQASLALEKARLLNEAEREKERAETERERSDALYRVSNLLASAHDTDEVLDLIVNEAVRLLGTSFCHIRLLEGDELVVRVATGPGGEYIMEHDATVKVGEGTSLTGHVWATKKPLSGKDAAQYSHQARVGIWQNKVESQKRWLRFLSWPMTSP